MAQQESTSINPLEESLQKLTGDALSKTTGTSMPISYDDTSAGFRDPQGDVISITSSPGSGASQAETWKHELDLEALRREQLTFEYNQAQDVIANALRQQEEQRAQTAASQTAASHAAALKQSQQDLLSSKEALTASQQSRNLKSSEAARAEAEFKVKYGYTPSEIMAGKPQQDTAKSYVASKANFDATTLPKGVYRAPAPDPSWSKDLQSTYSSAYQTAYNKNQSGRKYY